MNKSYTKKRHIQQVNQLLEQSFLNKKVIKEQNESEPEVGDVFVLWRGKDSEKSNDNKKKLGDVKITAIRKQQGNGVVELDAEILPNFKYPVLNQLGYELSSLVYNYGESMEEKYKNMTIRFSCKNGSKLSLSPIRSTPIFSDKITYWYLTNFCQGGLSSGQNTSREKIWYALIDGKKQGPFTAIEIIDKVPKGNKVWKSGMSDWTNIETTKEFQDKIK